MCNMICNVVGTTVHPFFDFGAVWLPMAAPALLMLFESKREKRFDYPILFLTLLAFTLPPVLYLFKGQSWMFTLFLLAAWGVMGVGMVKLYKSADGGRFVGEGVTLATLFFASPLLYAAWRGFVYDSMAKYHRGMGGDVSIAIRERDWDVWIILGLVAWVCLSWLWLLSQKRIEQMVLTKKAALLTSSACVVLGLGWLTMEGAPPDGDISRDVLECDECRDPFDHDYGGFD